MVDTPRTVSFLLGTSFPTNGVGAIDAQDMRDFVVSSMLVQTTSQAASYTAVLADGWTVVEMNSASAVNFTVPPNASVAFEIGAALQVCQYGAGQVTIVAGAGVTLRTPTGTLTTRAQYSIVGLQQRAANEWIVSGDLT